MGPDDLAIDVRGVHKSYGSTHALSDVNLQVRHGESRAIAGRNGAGKSTLIGMLTGLDVPDRGTVTVSPPGNATGSSGPGTIACVFQKNTLVPSLTAAENIALGSYPTRFGGIVDWAKITGSAEAVLAEWGVAHTTRRKVADLQPVERKIVEICRALSRGPSTLLLDEPTAGLDDGAARVLFDRLQTARKRGVTLIYVSHHLEELYEVCDTLTVIRDGRDVHTGPVADLAVTDIVDLMVGQFATTRAGDFTGAATRIRGEAPVLEVLDVQIDGHLDRTSLSVRAGECLGLTGLDGSGHVALARAMAGVTEADAGRVIVGGQTVKPGAVREAIAAGIGFVPEDRQESGFVAQLSVEENSTLSILRRLTNFLGLVNATDRRSRYLALAKEWALKASGPTQPAGELSGGNQQKVVLARALAADPRILILINPTAGVDVSAKESIYRTLSGLLDQGCAVIVCSSDDADLAICDRLIVMFKRRHFAELAAGWDNRELVAATQGSGRDHASPNANAIEGESS